MSDDFIITKLLDQPKKYLFWSLDEFLALSLPILIGIFANTNPLNKLYIILFAPITFGLLRSIKSKLPLNVIHLEQITYWYLNTKPIGITLRKINTPTLRMPPSYIRRYLGK
ncbi:MAG: type IV conjugative transfer system protein TraL [Sphingobacteriia bacterium]|nr:type IV conjugative transfer system protein TraL [Sphingobacteriia bacterium]